MTEGYHYLFHNQCALPDGPATPKKILNLLVLLRATPLWSVGFNSHSSRLPPAQPRVPSHQINFGLHLHEHLQVTSVLGMLINLPGSSWHRFRCLTPLRRFLLLAVPIINGSITTKDHILGWKQMRSTIIARSNPLGPMGVWLGPWPYPKQWTLIPLPFSTQWLVPYGDLFQGWYIQEEFAAIYRVVATANQLCISYNIASGSVTIGCDCELALHNLSSSFEPLPNQPHHNLLTAICHMIAKSPIAWAFQNVWGHQGTNVSYAHWIDGLS